MAVTIIATETMTIRGVSGYVPDTTVVETRPSAQQDERSLLWSYTRSFGGTWTALCALSLQIPGVKSIQPHQGGFFTMTAVLRDLLTAGGGASADPDEQVVTLYAWENQQETFSIWDHSAVKAGLESVTDLVLRADLVARMKALASGTNFIPTADTGGTISTPQIEYDTLRTDGISIGFSGALFDQVIDDLALETPSIPWDFPVLSRQTVAPLTSSVRMSWSLQNRVMTTSALLGRFTDMPLIFREELATDFAGGYWRGGGVTGSQIDGATARILQRFYYLPSVPSTFRWGTIITS